MLSNLTGTDVTCEFCEIEACWGSSMSNQELRGRNSSGNMGGVSHYPDLHQMGQSRSG